MSEEAILPIVRQLLPVAPTKLAMFTDIHFGCHQNSVQHNQDCSNFVDWLIEQVHIQGADAIAFLGDWFEHRNNINVLTQKFSVDALRKLNSIGMPIYFLIGNHDLYHRHNREVHSAEMFKEFTNIHVIDQPLSINNTFLFLPFLFKEEYPQIVNEVNKHRFVFGHFEFRNFYLTGTSHKAEHGYHHNLFDGPDHIFSGHYHKRQATDNVIYIGNPFATSYADAGDYCRGMCLLDCETSEVDFIDYAGPTYLKTKLSEVLSGDVEPLRLGRVRCLIDVDISYSEAQSLKTEFMALYELREFSLEENSKEQQQSLTESAIEELEELDLGSLNETVKKLIETGVQATATIDPAKLVALFDEL